MKKTKRWLSGALAALICCSSIFSSGQIARAAEIAKPEIKTSPVTENLEPEGAELYNSNLTTLPDMDMPVLLIPSILQKTLSARIRQP